MVQTPPITRGALQQAVEERQTRGLEVVQVFIKLVARYKMERVVYYKDLGTAMACAALEQHPLEEPEDTGNQSDQDCQLHEVSTN